MDEQHEQNGTVSGQGVAHCVTVTYFNVKIFSVITYLHALKIFRNLFTVVVLLHKLCRLHEVQELV